MMAIATAVFCGMILTINAVLLRHYVKVMKITSMQLNTDGGIIQMFVLVILFTLYVRDNGMYDTFDLLEGILASFLSMCASITLAQAFSVGLGGPVQGINNLMSVVQTVMAALILGQVPTLVQYLGLLCGVFGAFIMCGVDKIIKCR